MKENVIFMCLGNNPENERVLFHNILIVKNKKLSVL